MATADMTGVKTIYEQAFRWSKFLIQDLIEKREAGEQGIRSSVYPFCTLSREGEGTKTILPTAGLPLGHPPEGGVLSDILEMFLEDHEEEDLFSYLVLITGMPDPPNQWRQEEEQALAAGQAAPCVPIAVPWEMCERFEDRPPVYYIIAALVCRERPVTFTAHFDGEEFGELRFAPGLFGGELVDALGMGTHS